jgi:lipopolysaccharide export system permease protein
MKRLDRYLILESLPPAIFGMLLYSTLGVVSATIPRLQWITGAPFTELLGWLALQYPTSIVQTLTMALVLGVLLRYGRLADDSALTAIQAGGIALSRVTRIFVVLGVVATLLTLLINQFVLPVTHTLVAKQYWELTSGGSGLFRLASQDVGTAGFTLNFKSIDRKTDTMRDVRIEQWAGRQLTVLFAQHANFEADGLRLVGYRTLLLDLASLDEPHADATQAFEALVRADNRPASESSSLLLTMSESVDELIARYGQGGFEDPVSLSGSWLASQDPEVSGAERRRMLVLFWRKVAEPFANLALLLLALPLAVRYARSRSIAFGLSLVVTLAWYLLLTFGQLLAQTGTLPVWLGMWLANIVLAGAGLFVRARMRAGA